MNCLKYQWKVYFAVTTASNIQMAPVSFAAVYTFKGPGKEIFFECKFVIIFLTINLNMWFGAQKNRLNEMVLLNTHNICFG